MSVKNKVKRLNKIIVELEKENKKLKSETIPLDQIFKRLEINKEQEYKDNFIKLVINRVKGLENSCCRLRISERELQTMKNAKLEVERSYEYLDTIDFTLKI